MAKKDGDKVVGLSNKEFYIPGSVLRAKVDNTQFRLLKLGTPGPFTFILEATKEVPRRVSHPSRRTIGLRVPEHPVCQGLLD